MSRLAVYLQVTWIHRLGYILFSNVTIVEKNFLIFHFLDLAHELAGRMQVVQHIHPSLFLILFDEVVDHMVVEVFITEIGVTCGGQGLKDTVVNRKEGDVKGSTSEIVDDDLLLTTLLVKTVGNGCRC